MSVLSDERFELDRWIHYGRWKKKERKKEYDVRKRSEKKNTHTLGRIGMSTTVLPLFRIFLSNKNLNHKPLHSFFISHIDNHQMLYNCFSLILLWLYFCFIQYVFLFQFFHRFDQSLFYQRFNPSPWNISLLVHHRDVFSIAETSRWTNVFMICKWLTHSFIHS